MLKVSENPIKAKMLEIYKVCKEECFNLKEASEEIVSTIYNTYGFNLHGPLYYNEFNIVLYSIEDANFFVNIFPQGSVLAQMSVGEFDTHLFIFRYHSDQILESILV